MTDTYIKLNANNGGPYNESQNIIDFTIPSGSVYNLRDSYVNINTILNVVEASTAEGVGVYLGDAVWTSTPEVKIPNSVLVRDCRISSDRQGVIEDLSRIDQLSNVIQQYGRNAEEGESDNYLNMNVFMGNVNPYQNSNSIFVDANKLGNVKSTYNTINPISIRLGDLMDFCNIEEVDTNRTGNIHIRLRCNFDKLGADLKITPRQRQPELARAKIADVTKTMEFQDLTGASTGQTLVTKYRFNRLNQSPFFVGQKIVLKADIANAGTGGNQVDKPAVISSINWNTTLGDANAGYITLEFEQAPFTALDGNGESYENVSAVPAVWTSASFTYDFAEIVLKEVGSPQGADSLAYKTYHTTQDNGNGLLSYQGQFVLRPATNNMLILFPTDTSDLQSNNEQLKSYNIRVNNEDLIDNREVTFRTPLQLDRINMTLSNMDIGAENLLQNAGSSNIGSVYRYLEPTNGLVYDNRIIMNPLPQTGNDKLLQLNMVAETNGVKAITIFTEEQRMFSY